MFQLSIKRAKEINSIDTVEEFLSMIEGVPKDQKDIIIEGEYREYVENSLVYIFHISIDNVREPVLVYRASPIDD